MNVFLLVKKNYSFTKGENIRLFLLVYEFSLRAQSNHQQTRMISFLITGHPKS